MNQYKKGDKFIIELESDILYLDDFDCYGTLSKCPKVLLKDFPYAHKAVSPVLLDHLFRADGEPSAVLLDENRRLKQDNSRLMRLYAELKERCFMLQDRRGEWERDYQNGN